MILYFCITFSCNVTYFTAAPLFTGAAEDLAKCYVTFSSEIKMPLPLTNESQ